MSRRYTLLTGLSVFALSGAAALSGCSGEGEGGEGKSTSGAHQSHKPQGASGEGEGGEGAAVARAAEDIIAYLSALMAIKGHLTSGIELYRAGDGAGAATHMKHPKDEIYTQLEPAFAKRGQRGFSAELEALSASAAGGAALGVVLERQGAVFAAIDRHIAAAGPSVKEQLLAVAALVETAGREFDDGVKHGTVVNIHEYQDAHGFLSVAVSTLAVLETGGGEADAAVGAARDQAALALAVAPGVAAPELVSGESSTIYGAAARIELKARALP